MSFFVFNRPDFSSGLV